MPPRRSLRLTVAAIAGALLAVLAAALAVWSKDLVKDAARYEAADRAGEVQAGIGSRLRRALLDLRDHGRRPPAVAAIWRLDGDLGVVDPPDGASAGAPPEAFIAGVRGHAGAEPVGLEAPSLDGPLAASWVPAGDGAGAAVGGGHLVLWDVDAVIAELVEPELRRARGRGRWLAEIDPRGAPAPSSFDDTQLRTLDPPLSAWRIGVAVAEPARFRWGNRIQTGLTIALAGALLAAAGAAVVTDGRRARAEVARAERRSAFLARAYHELQTPLALLRAASETVEAGTVTEPDDLKRCARIVAREEARLTATVRRLLRYLQLEARAGGGGGGDPDDPTTRLVSVAEEVESLVEERRPAFADAGVALETNLDAIGAGVLGPAALIGDVVRELLANVERHAADATRAGVTLAPVPGRDAVTITVFDDGAGPGGDPSALAEPLARGAADDRGGTGLGLALISEGLAAVGGRLDLAARAPRGLEAVVLLPVTAHAPSAGAAS